MSVAAAAESLYQTQPPPAPAVGRHRAGPDRSQGRHHPEPRVGMVPMASEVVLVGMVERPEALERVEGSEEMKVDEVRHTSRNTWCNRLQQPTAD